MSDIYYQKNSKLMVSSFGLDLGGIFPLIGQSVLGVTRARVGRRSTNARLDFAKSVECRACPSPLWAHQGSLPDFQYIEFLAFSSLWYLLPGGGGGMLL